MECWYSNKEIRTILKISNLYKLQNVFSDVDLINLRDRGDVVSPKVLKYN